ncbi:DUF2470 domain-containing protein [Krasilnikovia sp. MM14-A1004]|uniref:DUF2470 domain-containing protein n=1 Tax=Krasilnikovia sp. MM14-A1004 TaxID=3373541 RepID=UPI00399C57D1
MHPSPAEVARTIVAGHLPATAHVSGHPGALPVRHVTDARGNVLLLSPRDGALAAALHPADGTDDTAMVLDVKDVPPIAGAPSLGRVWVVGWARALAGAEARAAALDYADTDATGDLLDVGGAQMLHRMEVAEIRHERHGALHELDSDEYAEAAPDPLRAIEFDLLADLADHHVAQVAAYANRSLGAAAQPGDEPRVVRLDRYGLVVRAGARLARLPFPAPVADRHELAHLLHPVLCRHCTA